MKNNILTLFTLFLMTSCIYNTNEVPQLPNTAGLDISISNFSFDETYANVLNTLNNNPNIGVVAEVNHSSNAASVNLELPNTRVVLFGNPNLGTPLMQENQLAGLDLPQKMLFYEDKGNVFVAYNTTDYLGARHEVAGVGTLNVISGALENIAASATEASTKVRNAAGVTANQGIVSLVSENDFNTTITRLRNSINANENLRLVAEVDHQQNAVNVGMELRPTSLFVFGNPNLGTPLMQESRTTAIDLPQKILVWQNAEGVVNISYNSPEYLASRHTINGNETILTTIAGALNNLSSNAASASN